MELPRHSGPDESATVRPPNRRTGLIVAAIAVALVALVVLHLSGVVGPR
jgi:hypothetical protein